MTSKRPKSGARQGTRNLLITEQSFKKIIDIFLLFHVLVWGFFVGFFVMDHQSRISTRNHENVNLRSKILFLNEITMYLKFKKVSKHMTMLT